MDRHSTPASSSSSSAAAYILLPTTARSQPAAAAAAPAPAPRPRTGSRLDKDRIHALETSLRETRALTAAASPATLSFSNFHSLLLLPDFPRPPPRSAQAGPTQARIPPPSLTPWEELSLRRDAAADKHPYRDWHQLTGKRKRRQQAHPSWADAGMAALPLISTTRMLDTLERALRLGFIQLDPSNLSTPSPRPDDGVPPSTKRRRCTAGYHIGGRRPACGSEEDEIDADVLAIFGTGPPPATTTTADLADDGDGADSVHSSEVDEWEVEVAATLAQSLPSSSTSSSTSTETTAQRSRSALAVPIYSHPNLLQVPHSEAERRAWNGEARQQRRQRTGSVQEGVGAPLSTSTTGPVSQVERDPESTLPVDMPSTSQLQPDRLPVSTQDLEATLTAAVSQPGVYDKTSPRQDG